MNAVKVLLDCANITSFKNYSSQTKRENQSICPWGVQKRETKTLLPRFNTNVVPFQVLKHNL